MMPFPFLPQETCMKKTRQLVATTLFAALSAATLVGHAQTIRIANQGDALSMDRIRSMNRCN